MARAAAEKSEKKTKSAGGAGKKLSAYNKFMKEELARLKEANPDQSHKERFKIAAQNWKHSPLNAKKDAK